MAMVNERTLIQPFLPGAPGGRGNHGDGKAKRVSDDNWEKAFPDCKFNKTLAKYIDPELEKKEKCKKKKKRK